MVLDNEISLQHKPNCDHLYLYHRLQKTPEDRNDRGLDVNVTSISEVEVLVILVGSFIRLDKR